MEKMGKTWLCAAMLALAPAVVAQAGDPTKEEAKAAKQHEESARKIGESAQKKIDYVNRLALFDQNQIALAKVAEERAENPKVKELAQKLERDHQKHLSDLRDWAHTKSIEIVAVSEMMPGHAVGGAGKAGMEEQSAKGDKDWNKEHVEGVKQRDELKSLSGMAFDEEYVKLATRDQEKGRDLARKGGSEYRDDAVFASFLLKTEGTLNDHIAELKRVKEGGSR
jgi:putative membrane protein